MQSSTNASLSVYHEVCSLCGKRISLKRYLKPHWLVPWSQYQMVTRWYQVLVLSFLSSLFFFLQGCGPTFLSHGQSRRISCNHFASQINTVYFLGNVTRERFLFSFFSVRSAKVTSDGHPSIYSYKLFNTIFVLYMYKLYSCFQCAIWGRTFSPPKNKHTYFLCISSCCCPGRLSSEFWRIMLQARLALTVL